MVDNPDPRRQAADSDPISITPQLSDLIAAVRPESKKKDIWDRFAAVSGFLSAITAAILGGVFTYVYQDQQRRHDDMVRDQQQRQEETAQRDQARLQQLQTIAQFMPYLTSEDESKQRVAITAIQTLASTEVALNLARLNPSKGVEDAVVNIAANAASSKDRVLAATTLNQIRCGVERWSAKTLANDMKREINLQPRPATIAELVSLSTPSAHPEDGRMDGTEKQTFQVRAQLVVVKHEMDDDYHLVLADPEDASKTMVAEIPSPGCAPTSGLGDTFRQAREAVDRNVQKIERSTVRISRPVAVIVIGVGFFDIYHGQLGMARNGIELHPVLNIEFPGSAKQTETSQK